MKLALDSDQIKAFYSQPDDKLVIFQPVQFIIAYDYDRNGNVRLTDAWRYYGYLNFAIYRLGGTTQDG